MLRFLSLAVITIFLLGCDSQKTEKLEPMQLRLALAMQPSNGLTMVALENAYFKKHGLDVTVSQHPSGKRAMHDALLADKADIASSADVPIVKHAFIDDDIVVLATAFNADNVNRIIARADSGIKTPTDLKGKRIATQHASAVHFFMHLFLLENGMDESQMTVSYMKAEKLPTALANNEIDAFSMREPYISQARDLLGDNSVVFASPGAYRQGESIITKKAFLEHNPEVVDRYLHALVDAEHFMLNNPKAAQQIIADTLKVPVSQLRENWDEYQFRLSMEQTSVILMEDIARWMLYQGIVDHQTIPNFIDGVAVEPLKKHKPEAVNITQ